MDREVVRWIDRQMVMLSMELVLNLGVLAPQSVGVYISLQTSR